MKKTISVLLIIAFVFCALAGCSGTESDIKKELVGSWYFKLGDSGHSGLGYTFDNNGEFYATALGENNPGKYKINTSNETITLSFDESGKDVILDYKYENGSLKIKKSGTDSWDFLCKN